MKDHEKLPSLTVVQVGCPNFERYQIGDEHGRLWTGNGFGASGQLYANHHHAALDAHQILKSHYQDVEPQRFVVPLYVEAFSREPIDWVDVARYLSRASRLYLNTTEWGHGPGQSLVLPWIEWSEIKRGVD